MEGFAARRLFSFVLILVILVQAGIVLFDVYSYGVLEEKPWFSQWPFCVDGSGLKASPYNFACNDSYVEVVVGFREGYCGNKVKLFSLVKQKNGRVTNQFSIEDKIRSVTISVPTERVSSFVASIVNEECVKFVEPNWKFFIDSITNDPEWINQWAPTKIEADKAWENQKGNRSILVAIVDTGVYYRHPDLSANYVPLGYDWVNDDSDPADDHGHGTHVAGIIAAVTNNSVGISGVAQVGVMAEKGLAHNGVGYADDLANAIVHAVDQGARIISCSWGSSSDSQLIYDAVRYATNAGALVIAAAGNSGNNEKQYPAAYSEVVAVTATNEKDKPASFTTYGDWVDVAAPGTSVYSTFLWDTYVSFSGTSMAAPHVAGVAALVWSEYPSFSNEQVRSQLLNTADDLGVGGFDVYYGYGRVNARKAVARAVSLTGSRIIEAPANTVYFLLADPSVSGSAEASYDVVASGVVYGLLANPQTQFFTSDADLLLPSGALNASVIAGGAAVLVGGPCALKTVQYYEDAGLTPLRFAANVTHFMFVSRAGVVVAALNKAAVESGHEDMFVVEVFADGPNFVLVLYGFTWKGTWASGVYFKEVIVKTLSVFSGDGYVFHWVDKGKRDGVPKSGEIHLEFS